MKVPVAPILANGNPPASEAAVLAQLARLGIAQTTVRHAAVFTVAEAKAIRGELPGSHIKNLFLRNKGGRMWLVTCQEDRQIDLRELAGLLGAGRFSFASAERMMLYLGVSPGAVTPLAVINDSGAAVQVVLDRAILGRDLIHVHPLHNAATTSLAPAGLLNYLETLGHAPAIVDMDARPMTLASEASARA